MPGKKRCIIHLNGAIAGVMVKGTGHAGRIFRERRIPAEHPLLTSEATYEQTVTVIRKLGARRVILTHIEEPDGLSYDDLLRLEEQLQRESFDVRFAYDTLVVPV